MFDMIFADSPSSTYAGSRPRGSEPCAKVIVSARELEDELEDVVLVLLARWLPQPVARTAAAPVAHTAPNASTNFLLERLASLMLMRIPLSSTVPDPWGFWENPMLFR